MNKKQKAILIILFLLTSVFSVATGGFDSSILNLIVGILWTIYVFYVMGQKK